MGDPLTWIQANYLALVAIAGVVLAFLKDRNSSSQGNRQLDVSERSQSLQEMQTLNKSLVEENERIKKESQEQDTLIEHLREQLKNQTPTCPYLDNLIQENRKLRRWINEHHPLEGDSLG